jgi:hypothetical protein
MCALQARRNFVVGFSWKVLQQRNGVGGFCEIA